jgi:hypothetical protein
MTIYTDLQSALEATGHKVFSIKKLDTVKTAIVFKSISQRAYGSHSGSAGLRTERIQVSCFATTDAALKEMVEDVETALAWRNITAFTSIPTESKIEGFDEKTSTFYSFRDYLITYKGA